MLCGRFDGSVAVFTDRCFVFHVHVTVSWIAMFKGSITGTIVLFYLFLLNLNSRLTDVKIAQKRCLIDY